jgi:hypothetical protein
MPPPAVDHLSGHDRSNRCAMADLGCAPTMRSISCPALSTSRVGRLRTLKRAAVTGFSSTFSFATRTRPPISAASSSITGASIRHGPHHAAHMSSSTGSGERSTSAENVASVTVTGLLETSRGVLHRPHTGSSPCAILARGTRLVAPQAGQRSNCVSDISFMTSHPTPMAQRTLRHSAQRVKSPGSQRG